MRTSRTGALSLTKHYVFGRLVSEIASLRPGMTQDEVSRHLQSPHVELADDIFAYDANGLLRDSILLRVCRGRTPGAVRIVWVALVSADSRLQALLTAMALPTGAIDMERYSTTDIELLLEDVAGVRSRKAASNVAHYFEQARIVEPERQGSEIVGAQTSLDTRTAVPLSVSYLMERLAWENPGESALLLGVHTWLNLSEQQFRQALSPNEDSLGEEGALGSTSESSQRTRSRLPGLALPYLEEDVEAGIAAPVRSEFDTGALEDSTRVHRTTQNALAAWAVWNGMDPVSPDGDPLFDVGWWRNGTFYVAEVKSLNPENEAGQVRLGLGQTLDYRKQLRDLGYTVRGVLALSQEPQQKRWEGLAAESDIDLTWPPFNNLAT